MGLKILDSCTQLFTLILVYSFITLIFVHKFSPRFWYTTHHLDSHTMTTLSPTIWYNALRLDSCTQPSTFNLDSCLHSLHLDSLVHSPFPWLFVHSPSPWFLYTVFHLGFRRQPITFIRVHNLHRDSYTQLITLGGGWHLTFNELKYATDTRFT